MKSRVILLSIIAILGLLAVENNFSAGNLAANLAVNLPEKSTEAENAFSSGRAPTDKQQIIDLVMAYVNEEKENDPLIEIEPDIWVKQSNIEGVDINGTTYYYSLFPHMSYDPVAAGKLSVEEVEVLMRDETLPLTIYTEKRES